MPATDSFSTYERPITGSARRAEVVVPSDNELGNISRAIYVGGAGDLVVILADEAVATTFKAVPVGTLLPIRVKVVKASSTATFIVSVF